MGKMRTIKAVGGYSREIYRFKVNDRRSKYLARKMNEGKFCLHFLLFNFSLLLFVKFVLNKLVFLKANLNWLR